VLQELAARTGAQAWAIASMLFFLAVFAAVALRTWRTAPEAAERWARLPLAADGQAGTDSGSATGAGARQDT
jgi:hypothetical protein